MKDFNYVVFCRFLKTIFEQIISMKKGLINKEHSNIQRISLIWSSRKILLSIQTEQTKNEIIGKVPIKSVWIYYHNYIEIIFVLKRFYGTVNSVSLETAFKRLIKLLINVILLYLHSFFIKENSAESIFSW